MSNAEVNEKVLTTWDMLIQDADQQITMAKERITKLKKTIKKLKTIRDSGQS